MSYHCSEHYLLCPARFAIFPNYQWQGRLCRNLFDGKFQLKILFYHALNSSLLGLSLIWCVIFYNKSNFHPNTFIVDLAAPLHFLPPQATTQVTGEILQCLKLIFTEPFLFQWRVQSSSFSFNRVTRLHNSPSPPTRKVIGLWNIDWGRISVQQAKWLEYTEYTGTVVESSARGGLLPVEKILPGNKILS